MNVHIDLRSVDILRAIGGLEKYLSVMEAQLEEVHRIERHTLALQHPSDADKGKHDAHLQELDYLDDLYERDLQPAMRYSFVVLVHIVFDTQIRYSAHASSATSSFQRSRLPIYAAVLLTKLGCF